MKYIRHIAARVAIGLCLVSAPLSAIDTTSVIQSIAHNSYTVGANVTQMLCTIGNYSLYGALLATAGATYITRKATDNPLVFGAAVTAGSYCAYYVHSLQKLRTVEKWYQTVFEENPIKQDRSDIAYLLRYTKQCVVNNGDANTIIEMIKGHGCICANVSEKQRSLWAIQLVQDKLIQDMAIVKPFIAHLPSMISTEEDIQELTQTDSLVTYLDSKQKEQSWAVSFLRTCAYPYRYRACLLYLQLLQLSKKLEQMSTKVSALDDTKPVSYVSRTCKSPLCINKK